MGALYSEGEGLCCLSPKICKNVLGSGPGQEKGTGDRTGGEERRREMGKEGGGAGDRRKKEGRRENVGGGKGGGGRGQREEEKGRRGERRGAEERMGQAGGSSEPASTPVWSVSRGQGKQRLPRYRYKRVMKRLEVRNLLRVGSCWGSMVAGGRCRAGPGLKVERHRSFQDFLAPAG